MHTSLCDELGIEFPIFAFTHCRDVVVAVSKAGGYGVLGAVGYTPEELEKHRGWGHSSWEQACEVAERAGVKLLALTHHDPAHDDEMLRGMEKACQQRFKDSFFARDQLVVDI